MTRVLATVLLLAVVLQTDEPARGETGQPGSRGDIIAVPTIPGASLGIQQAIRIGLTRHPSLDQTRYASAAAKAVTKQLKGDRYPWLDASIAGASGSLRIVTSDGRTIHDRGGRGFDPGGALPHHNQNMLTGGLILNQLITDFGYTAHRVLASEATEAAQQKEAVTKKALVILNVQKAFINALLQERLVVIAQETLTRRRAVRDQVDALYKHQLRSKMDLDLISVEVSNAELALIRANSEVKTHVAALTNAMGLQGPADYRLEDIAVDVAPLPDLDILVEEGLKHRPELLGSDDKIHANEELLKAAKALNFGSLSAVGSLGVTKYWDVHDSGLRNDEVAPFWGAGATLRVPLFTGFKIQSQVTEAQHVKAEAVHERENLANEIILQIIRAYLTQATNADQIALEQERVHYAREALALAQERYKLGLGPILEVVRATAAVFEAESRLAEARYLYKIGEVVVGYATGHDYTRY
jgi:outer membrane protein